MGHGAGARADVSRGFERRSDAPRRAGPAYAAQDARRREERAGERVTVREVQALLAARYARSARFGMDLANPGWSLLLELFRAYLEKRPARLGRLATDARVAGTTALRWVEQLCGAGYVRRDPDPERQGRC